MNEREVMELIGDPREIDKSLTAFRKSMDSLSSRYSKLLERYPQEWVAIHAGRVRAHGESMEAVLKEVEAKGLARGETLLWFMETEPSTLIL